jgi:predicted amidohydrolase
VVSRKRARHGAHGRGAAVLSDRHRQRTAAGAAGEFARSLAAHTAGACGREPHARDRLEPHWRPSARCQNPDDLYIRFYGSSFIADPTAEKWRKQAKTKRTVLTAKFDLAAIEEMRNNWFVFRDRGRSCMAR